MVLELYVDNQLSGQDRTGVSWDVIACTVHMIAEYLRIAGNARFLGRDTCA
jgi:hypothetical protein